MIDIKDIHTNKFITETEHDLSITKYNDEKEIIEKRLAIEEVEEIVIEED